MVIGVNFWMVIDKMNLCTKSISELFAFTQLHLS